MAVKYKALKPDVGTTGLGWRPPATLHDVLQSAPRETADGLLQQVLQESPECYGYVAASGDSRPNPDADANLNGLPVLLGADEVGQQPNWADWNRLGTSMSFFPGTRGPALRSFLTVQLFSNRESYLSYEPDSQNHYDLTKPPVQRVLTRPQMVEHWNRLQRHETDGLERDRVVWLLFGVSPKGFKLGDTTTGKSAPDEVAYYGGVAYLLNPYGAVTFGWSTDDGKRFRPGFGVNLDFGIITAIFK
jgi:hypothetical protein